MSKSNTKGRAAAIAAAKALGAKVVYEYNTRISYVYQIEAPDGYLWVDGSCNSLVVEQHTIASWGSPWADALDRIKCGLRPDDNEGEEE